MVNSKRKYALVTGASSGMGREYARLLAAQGYALVMVSDRDAENRSAAEQIAAAHGVEIWPFCLDLAVPDAAGTLYAWTERHGIEVEILICNAGVLLWGPLTAVPPEKLSRLVALHCSTPTLLCRLYTEGMRRRGHGAVLVMSSATAWMPFPTLSAYAATKSYLLDFANALHDELASEGVVVTTVLPGAVDTPFYRLDEAWRRRLVAWGVMWTPERVARKGLRALSRGRRRCIPGLFTKLCVWFCRLLPAGAMRLIVRLPAVQRLL